MEVGQTRISIVGLGYVGLPIACAFDQAGFQVVGYDIDPSRIEELEQRYDRTRECASELLSKSKILFTVDPLELRKTNFIIITVPTPIDKAMRPDLTALVEASITVGKNLSKGSMVVFESTVYPGVTEEVCVPLLEANSKLKLGVDFKVGYCPERINPGDKNHTLDKVIKVVSASDESALEKVAEVYRAICKAGIWKASSIKTAEAAKVIENVQRDLNIALMNELSVLFKKIGINTKEVLDAASTKWNFHRYVPGLVGGHCIGVDPYYLTYLAQVLGHHPELILAGRRINDQIPHHVVSRILLGLVKAGKLVNKSKILILGLTFKENIPDTRNSKVYHIIEELKQYGSTVFAVDPFVDSQQVSEKFHAHPAPWPLDGAQYDALVMAVAHDEFKEKLDIAQIEQHLNLPGVVFDLKWLYDPSCFGKEVFYESL